MMVVAARQSKLGRLWHHVARSEWLHYAVVSLLVMGPLLATGYIFALDMVFAPVMPMPEQVSNNYLFGVLLHWVTLVIPGDWVQKVLLLAILTLAGVGMHQLARLLQKPDAKEIVWPAYAAGLFYVLNPFAYSRFMAGQYLVLLGYALLPFLLRWLWQLTRTPSWRNAVMTGLLATVIGIVSIHAVGIMVIMALVVAAGAVWRLRRRKRDLRKLARFGGAALALFLLLSSYWVIPLLADRGPTAEVLQDFTSADQTAFATEGEGSFAKINNVLHLQGFWLEGQDLFEPPQERLMGWGLVVLVLWAITITGFIAMWQTRHRQLAVTAGLFIALGFWLGSGISQSWLAANIPFMEGYRDSQKFVGLLALGMAIGIAFGAKYLFEKLAFRPTTQACAKLAVILLPVLFVPTMLWGFGGQLHTAHYPTGWYDAKHLFDRDHSDYQVLFVPWHQYMHFNFAGNLVANPAPKFFKQPVIISHDPEFEQLKAPPDDESTKVGTLLQAPNDQLGSQLKQYGVKYIVRAKELDYDKYNFLATQKDFRLVLENDSLQLYQNQAYQGER